MTPPIRPVDEDVLKQVIAFDALLHATAGAPMDRERGYDRLRLLLTMIEGRRKADIASGKLEKGGRASNLETFHSTLRVNESRPAELGQQPEASLAWRRGDPPCEA